MFAKVLIAFGIAAVPFGFMLGGSAPPEPSPVVTVDAQPELARQLPPVPPPVGFPASFRIQFQTSAGESADAVANYVGTFGPEVSMVWQTAPVTYTVDHRSLDTFQYTGTRVITAPLELQYNVLMKWWVLRMGLPNARLPEYTFLQRSPTDFDLPCSPFWSGSVRYFNFVIR